MPSTIENFSIVELTNYFSKMKESDKEQFEKLSYESKVALFKQLNYGWDALMFAASHQPAAVVPLLNAINNLETKDQADILKQLNHNGENVFMLAAHSQPSAVEPLLNIIKKLKPTDQADILKQRNSSGDNALTLAALYQPSNILPIIQMILSLSELAIDEKYNMIKKSLNSPSFSLDKYPKILHFKLIGDMDELVARLKPANSLDINYQLNPNSPQMLLYTALHDELERYKKSTYGQDAWVTFQSSWNKTINEARGTAAIQGLPEVASLLKTMLLVLSVIGIVYLAYQAGKNTIQNRSAFFQSANESTVNSLQDLLRKMPQNESNPVQSTDGLVLNKDLPPPYKA